jgi:hypothetical protein
LTECRTRGTMPSMGIPSCEPPVRGSNYTWEFPFFVSTRSRTIPITCCLRIAHGDLERQYEEAQAENKIVVFVKDNTTKRLMSFSFDNA